MTTISPERAKLGYLLDENEGEAFWLLGMLETIRISREDTGGAYGLIEIALPAGVGPPWHVHPEEDEWIYVLEGELTVWVEGHPDVERLAPIDACTCRATGVRCPRVVKPCGPAPRSRTTSQSVAFACNANATQPRCHTCAWDEVQQPTADVDGLLHP